MSWTRVFMILWRLQTRRWWNRLQVMRSWSLGASLGALVLLVLALLGLQLVLAGSLRSLLDADVLYAILQQRSDDAYHLLRYTRYEDVPDPGARLMLVFLNGCWLSSLFLKWGHWQSLQRDAEWEWFAASPWPAWPLVVQRSLVESLWPQGLSLFMGAFLVQLGVMRGLSLGLALFWSIILGIALQALVAAPRVTVDLHLRLRWPPAQVRSLRGWSGILGAGLLVLGMQALSLDQGWALSSALHWGTILDQTPAAWALSTVMLQDAWHHVGALFSLVILVHGLCYLWAAWLLRPSTSGLPGWSAGFGWRTSLRPGLMNFLWERLHPLTRRDLVLLGRDRHFLLQILVLPLLLALLPQSLPLQDPAWLSVIAFGTGFLFLWSAVFHILPMEGESLWMLFTWPHSLAKFLQRRLLLLLSLAVCYAGLVMGLGLLRMDTVSLEMGAIFSMMWGLGCLGLILMALMVFSYEPEAREREPRAGSLLYYGMLIPGALHGWFLFRPDAWASLFYLLALTGMAGVFWWRMLRALPTLLDRPMSGKKKLAPRTVKLYFLKFISR
ncbi:hypothetical protein [Oligoflexus tunisiensis]|uniref:hypothetical protein n=1 Tax=Oligoflexus tunisiensis TaxID=708132 RepID=UPI00114D3041|nr:hypothetical protein [Oligoflexus tunisiensis]